MKDSRLATINDIEPRGMRCPYCDKEFDVGDEIVSVFDHFVEDPEDVAIPIYLCMCSPCSERLDELTKCEPCNGTGAIADAQCSKCGGAGDYLPGGRTSDTEGTSPDA